MSYGKGSARPDAMNLPEHLIPHGMLGQIGRSQRPPQELNNSRSYHETNSAPSHTEFVSSAADAAFDNSNKLSHSSLLLLYDKQQQQLPQGMVNQYPDTKSAAYNSRWAGPPTGKAPYPTSNNFSNPDSLNDSQRSQQIPYNGRYQPQYTAHQVNRPQYQGQRLMTSTLSNPYLAPYANSSAGQLPRQGLRGTLQSQNGSSLSLDTTGSIQNPPYGAGTPFGTVPEYGYAEHPTSTNSGVTGQHDMPPSQPGMFGFPSAQTFNSNPRKAPSSMKPMPEVILTINMKDGLEYHDSFTGDTAVDVICSIIRTNDRNLALLLGRSLDAQKFFHDVTYNHRLRDLSHEVYTFSRNYNDVEFFAEDGNGHGSNNNSNRGSFNEHQMSVLPQPPSSAPYPTSSAPPSIPPSPVDGGIAVFGQNHKPRELQESSGVNGVFTILSNCYSPTCTRDSLCYSIACPRRLEQQARLNMKPRGGLKRAVSRLSLHDNETNKTLWHETVDQLVLDDLDKHEKMRQELIYELIYTERDYVKDLEFMTDFYILPLRNPANNIIPEREREAFIRTVFGGVSELLRLAKSLSEALTNRQQQQKPVVESVGDVFLQFVGSFDPFIKYSGNKVFASFEHERQQQVNIKYARFLDAIEKKPESRKQDLSSFLIKGVQRPARYQLLLGGILKNTNESSPDYKNLVKAKEEIEKVLNKINIQTGESTDRHKIMVLHRLLGRQTLEDRFNFKLNYNNRIIYQVTLSRKRDNEKIDLYLFEHALLLVKHKIQNKREVHKVFEKPIYLPLLFVNSGYDSPGIKSILQFRENGSIISDTSLRNRAEASNYNPVSSSQQKLQVNFLGLGNNPVHVSLYADDVTNQSQILLQVQQQQRKLLDKHDIFSLSKYETRRFTGHNRINCAVPCYGGKKLLYGTDAGVWVSTVRSISMTSNEKICSDPTMVISKPYISQMEVLVEYSKLLVLSEKTLYEFDLSCTDSLDHVKNTRSGKIILNYVSFFKTGVCDGRLLVCAVKSGSAKAISIVEPTNPFDSKMRGKGKKPEVREIAFMSEPVSISFLKTKLCIGCTKGFEILSLEAGRKEPILDEADPSLDFATQRESVAPLGIHRLGKNFLLSYSEFSFLINRNGWRTKHDWGIFWEGSPQNIALFYPYLLAFDPGFIEIRDLESTTLIRALIGENIRFLHSNEHEALYACEENGYDIIVSIDFLNLKPKQKS
ncbi:hypothetical protein C7M61_003043 [Candidozyma pseudohaemuli]|uniref:DH domain-containing protein n=1 Tax=Candidozyma pseudohaemuli TaxID=418784 RepID=A0A2P7YPA4_9ASCO|nr:hypothetical protein C7M61_003043 [[Candida] pseudohaemulonii]PSK37798.1 hypothetical protein C7M61_003043 [[Candida] pseudohaemulonii]